MMAVSEVTEPLAPPWLPFGRCRGDHFGQCAASRAAEAGFMIRKLKDGRYRLYSRKPDPKTGKRRNLGTFKTRAAAEKHERAVQFFKRRG